MGGTERVREVEEGWRFAHGDDFWPEYNSEGELETLLEMEFRALLRGLPRGVPAGMYPEEEVEGVRRVISARANYYGRAAGRIKFDIALMIGRRFPDREPKEDVFGFVEVKTETNLEVKAEGIEEALRHGDVERSRVEKMSSSERLLVQVFMQILKERNTATIVMGANRLYLMELDWRTGILMVDGPYFRIPPAGLEDKAFTPVDAMRVVARMYERKGEILREGIGREEAEGIEAQIRMPREVVELNAYTRALRLGGGRGAGVWEWLVGAAYPMIVLWVWVQGLWLEVVLATCGVVVLRDAAGEIGRYERLEDGGALNVGVVGRRGWVARVLGWIVGVTRGDVEVWMEGDLGGGEVTEARWGRVGWRRVVVKMNRSAEAGQERVVEAEWRRLREALPADTREGSGLPIPTYYGGFGGEEDGIVLMSYGGEALDRLTEQYGAATVMGWYEAAVAELNAAGVEVMDAALRNAVWDGERVRIIDFV
ncbi:hypothetical protein ACG7TL_006680 [Trametes sanguinea]